MPDVMPDLLPSPWRRFDPEDEGTWPDVDVLVLGWTQTEVEIVELDNGTEELQWWRADRRADWTFGRVDVTHWMPLPAPPTDKEVKGE